MVEATSLKEIIAARRGSQHEQAIASLGREIQLYGRVDAFKDARNRRE
jgi:hypothetical protein